MGLLFGAGCPTFTLPGEPCALGVDSCTKSRVGVAQKAYLGLKAVTAPTLQEPAQPPTSTSALPWFNGWRVQGEQQLLVCAHTEQDSTTAHWSSQRAGNLEIIVPKLGLQIDTPEQRPRTVPARASLTPKTVSRARYRSAHLRVKAVVTIKTRLKGINLCQTA